jgi:Ca2+/Na+ antiporter
VIAAILQHRSPLALGNVMGSTISNILGAFSLGLLFYPQGLEFDRSAKIYSALLFVVTTLFVVLAFFNQLNQIVGGGLDCYIRALHRLYHLRYLQGCSLTPRAIEQ